MTNLLSIVFGISFASGLNVYLTVLAMGLLHRYGVLRLPNGLEVLSTTPVLAGAGVLYAVEFFADKVPYFDSVWDGIHTFVRPAAAAVIAYSAVGSVAPEWQVIAALAGGTVALTSHAAKASARAAVNLTPEPFSNWALSLTEDGIALVLVWLVGSHPFVAIAAAMLLVIVAIWMLLKVSHLLRRVFRRSV
jgi:hypothetical protein